MRLYLLALLTLLVLLPASAQGPKTACWRAGEPDGLKDVVDVLGGELPCQLSWLQDDTSGDPPLVLALQLPPAARGAAAPPTKTRYGASHSTAAVPTVSPRGPPA